MTAFRLALFLAILSPSVVQAAGFARSDNFVVYTPAEGDRAAEQEYADAVIARAEKLRGNVAETWLGGKLPDGAGRSVIYVDFSTTEDSGLTWAKDHQERLFHNVWLTTTPDRAVGTTLHHEIVHTVLATKYPHPLRLPPWVEEGIATRCDDETRKSARDQLVLHWTRTGQAPNLVSVLAMKDMGAFDEQSYAASAFLVEYLLTIGDEGAVVEFAADGQRNGWNAALQSHYGIASCEQLQTNWQQWLAEIDDTL